MERVPGAAGPITVSTREVAASEQFAYWHSLLVRFYVDVDASVAHPPSRGYSGSLHRRHFGGCAIDPVVADPIRVSRSPSAVRRHPGHFYDLALLREGAAMVMQDGRAATQARPGDFVLVDSALPYVLELERRSSQAVFRIPRELVESGFPDARHLTAITVGPEKGIARLASQMLTSLCENGEDRCDQASFSAMSTVLMLAVTALRERTGRVGGAHPAEALLAEAREYMTRNIADADAVTPQRVAAAINVSERYLFKLFRQVGTTPQGWLRGVRLDRARRMLEEPTGRRSVHEVAVAVGFSSPAHFSRASSSHFGFSPREARRHAPALAG